MDEWTVIIGPIGLFDKQGYMQITIMIDLLFSCTFIDQDRVKLGCEWI